MSEIDPSIVEAAELVAELAANFTYEGGSSAQAEIDRELKTTLLKIFEKAPKTVGQVVEGFVRSRPEILGEFVSLGIKDQAVISFEVERLIRGVMNRANGTRNPDPGFVAKIPSCFFSTARKGRKKAVLNTKRLSSIVLK